MKRYAMAFGATFLLAATHFSFGQSKHIHEQVDPYTGRKALLLVDVETHTCPGDPPAGDHDPKVHLVFRALQREDHGIAYYLLAELKRGSSLNLHRGGTMDTIIDGTVGSFATKDGSVVSTGYESTVNGSHSFLQESIPFEVKRSELESLAKARSFQFRINGTNRNVQRCIDAKHLRELPEFLEAALTY